MPWWNWVVMGLMLTLVELALPTFFMLWLGIAAILVGIIVAMVDVNLAAQIGLWTLLSVVTTGMWFRYFRNPNRTTAGLSKDAVVGLTGLVSKEVTEIKRGEIMFQSPVMGSDRWPIVADTTIPAGEKAEVVDILGQTLKVKKSNH